MSTFDEDMASASVPVAAVVAGKANMISFQGRMFLRAYLTRATSPGGMQMTRAFTATVKGFNDTYGAKCRNWSQVAQCAYYLLSLEG